MTTSVSTARVEAVLREVAAEHDLAQQAGLLERIWQALDLTPDRAWLSIILTADPRWA